MPRSVQFNESEDMLRQTGRSKKKGSGKNKQPLLIRWAMKLPFVNTRNQANKVLVAAAIVILLISGYFWWNVFS